ncbi:FAD-dependent oxidoreductase [Psychromonas sp. SA13A]|uniref:FAD-dependent oxidoreductase n=1 Tax=Psychromonas sp. SA13A TaxID=2686346 RepID=UPI00140DD51F|nr:FAD-dependent oxidoreductase [Psychromonas sp. SA13A]
MTKNEMSDKKIAIIGGGIAGASIALYLSEIGLQVDLFEKGTSLVNGPPICHLHAGGNLYREISEEQCVTLLKESIEALRLYPDSVDYRPTVIAIPEQDPGQPMELLPRLKRLQSEYQDLIDEDADNQVLGKASDYYQLFELEELQQLALLDEHPVPSTAEQWMIPFAKHVDLSLLKFPVVLVQEFGWNVFRLGATAALSLEKNAHCQVHLNAKITKIEQTVDKKWQLSCDESGHNSQQKFDYLINAAGFKTGEIDDLAGFHRQRLVEFKAAYVTKWQGTGGLWPEVVFHGQRGTPEGMAQFTPYAENLVQLHGMTEQITLFDNGLVASADNSSQPQLDAQFIRKIDKGWLAQEVAERGQRAIAHLARYIPVFKDASVEGKPLFGAQQIPGEDASLRAAGVSFEDDNYARCEIVKASSVLTSADALTEKLAELGFVDKGLVGSRLFPVTRSITDQQVTERSECYTQQRGYPLALAHRTVKQS